MSLTLKHIWKPLVAIFFWGASFVATKSLLDSISPLGIIYIRIILGIVTALVIALFRKRNFTLQKKDLKGIFILSIISITHLWIQVTGMQYTSASNTGWIIGTVPVIMAIMGFIFYKERMNTQQLIGAAIAFSGLLVLISNGNLTSISFISNYGDLLVLGSAFFLEYLFILWKKSNIRLSTFINNFIFVSYNVCSSFARYSNFRILQ